MNWLSEKKRSQREIIKVFIQAARGLAAAHAVGLVHRDFKPENVLVGNDGRARVTDFGLARLHEQVVDQTKPINNETSGSNEPSGHSYVTQTGLIVGTPAYMAPEQYQAKRATPQTDQFSFCVALFEALEGTRPFAGESKEALQAATVDGQIRQMQRLPSWLKKTLIRWLQHDPARRFTSMLELLAVLCRGVNQRRRLATMAGIAAILTVLTTVGAIVIRQRAAMCTGG